MAKQYEIQVAFKLKEIPVGGTVIKGVPLGETLYGQSRVTVHERIKCRGIHLEIGYKEHGQGSPYEKRLVSKMPFQGALQPGRTWTDTFEFQVPIDGPISYSGKYANFTWFVRYRIDVPFWPDRREEFIFPVLPRFVDA